jgi:ABC-type glycerol-3-phosphate transport system substrate-binding protein
MYLKKGKILFIIGLFSITFFVSNNQVSESTIQAVDFEIVVPWGLNHERGQIIQSMIENHSTLGTKYNFIYTQVGGGPADRDALTARLLAGDYPNLLLLTQDWYTEYSQFGIWYDFSNNITAWSGSRAGWREDIPDGWWSVLDKENGNGTGTGIFALPFFGQTVLPYINLNDFSDVGLLPSDVDTIDGFLDAAKLLSENGKTGFAQVGRLQSDIAYMNYMLGSSDNYINSSMDPATVYGWDAENKY